MSVSEEHRVDADPGSLESLVETLYGEGKLKDIEKARTRIRLGFPSWLVLGELDGREVLEILSQACGIPVLDLGDQGLDLDIPSCRQYGIEELQVGRFAPLSDGSVAIADPFAAHPDGALAGRPIRLAAARLIDKAFEEAFPKNVANLTKRRRLGRFLLDSGTVNEEGLAAALDEQRSSGGRLGEILIAQGTVSPAALAEALASKIGLPSLAEGSQAVPMLPRNLAHTLGAVALGSVDELGERVENPTEPVVVAFSDPTDEKVEQVIEQLGRPVEAQVTDEETLDTLLAAVYARDDLEEVISSLQEQRPYFSAYRTGLSKSQTVGAVIVGVLLLIGVILNAYMTAIVAVAFGTGLYVLYTLYRLYCAWRGWRGESTINPSAEQLAAMDGRTLPTYTILLPVFKEKPATMRVLIDALSKLEYPKHKLHGLLLVEADDDQTQEALEAVGRPSWMQVLEVPDKVHQTSGRPGWLRTLLIPPGEPRTKPKAMIYGLIYARSDLLTIYDAEDQPEPDQLKKAAWAFQQVGDDVACIQAKLNYYNSRQNLLTRWFTLEYSAWFDLFLPGLHSMSAPIPLGGTSNHFRLDVLKEAMSWDPYNVTEDADLGLRFNRSGYTTKILESTTYEEANSRFKNWLRQRSRWIKGYMQTFLVHTREPGKLYRDLGLANTLHFFATIGGLIYTVLVSPIFWVLLCLWLLFQPGWIPGLFPGPVYYMAMASLVIGNFFFVFLALIGAVGRGQDDLSPYTLIVPVYWMMMSIAGYLALYELIRKPHYWQKTEHGLHFEQELEEIVAEQAP